MLERLDEIPWGALHHVYGTAEDVPDILRSLVAGEESAKEAVGELFGNIWHQGSIYEATAHAVPFLIEIFDSSSPVQKGRGLPAPGHRRRACRRVVDRIALPP